MVQRLRPWANHSQSMEAPERLNRLIEVSWLHPDRPSFLAVGGTDDPLSRAASPEPHCFSLVATEESRSKNAVPTTLTRRGLMLLKANASPKKELLQSTTKLVAAITQDLPSELPFEPRRPAWYDPWKVVVEFSACLVMLVLAAPLMLLAAVLVKLTSRGPAFYTQTRLGLDGREYTIYKLRTMFHNCERQSGACWSPAGDPRITRLGRWLRRTHIDELPQLWNVLRGEMSLVGPRPERPEFIPHLEKALPLYRLRRAVRPGVTGLAQVQLPPDTDLESVRRKLAYDLYYVYNGSPWLDLQLLAATAIHVLGVPYALIGKFLFLPSSRRIERLYRNLSVGHGTADSIDSAVNDQTAPVVDMKMAPCV